jgi:hypothetical protein
MRRGYAVALAVVAVLVAILIGVGAYNAGVNNGLAQAADPDSVVRLHDGYWAHGSGWGFFPFGFLLFPLVIVGFFLLFRFAFWGGRWGDHPHPHGIGPGGWGGREAFEEWHRHEHERQQTGPDPGERPDTA